MGKKKHETGKTAEIVADLVDDVNVEVSADITDPVPGWVHRACHTVDRFTAATEPDIEVPSAFLKSRLHEQGADIRKAIKRSFMQRRVGHRTRQIVYEIYDDAQPMLLNAYMDFSLLMAESVWHGKARAEKRTTQWKRLSLATFIVGMVVGVVL